MKWQLPVHTWDFKKKLIVSVDACGGKQSDGVRGGSGSYHPKGKATERARTHQNQGCGSKLG